MSENTLWAVFWVSLSLVLFGFMAVLYLGVSNQERMAKERFDKCLTEQMQYINGNCVIGRGK